MTARTSAPLERRAAITDSSSGCAEANTIASAMRTSSGVVSGAVVSNKRATSPATVNRPIADPILRAGEGKSRGGLFGRRRSCPDPDRREDSVLTELDDSFSNQFQRCGKPRGARTATGHGVDTGLEQPLVESRPVASLTDQPHEDLPRLGERPDAAGPQTHGGVGALLRVPGIGGQKFVQIGIVVGVPRNLDDLRGAPHEHIAPKARAIHQKLRGSPNGLEVAKAPRESVG